MATYTKLYGLTITEGAPSGDTVYDAVDKTDDNIDQIITDLNACHMTTRGDIIHRGASAITRLAIGGTKKILKSNGTDPEWTYDSGVTAVESTSAVTLTDSHETVKVTAATGVPVTVNLPTAVGRSGKRFTIKKVDATTAAVTWDFYGSETADGSTSIAMTAQWDYRTIESDGSNWLITGSS